MASKMRPAFTRLHAVTLDPATRPDELVAAIRAAEGVQDRHRLSEGAVYASACRRYLLDTGRSWKAEQVTEGATTWGESDHRPRVRMYDRPSPNGIRGEWRCSCGSSGTSADPVGAHAAHRAEAGVS